MDDIVLPLLIKQGCIHGSISHEHWAGALMEVRSLFGLNSLMGNGRTDGRSNGRMDKASYRVACLRLKIIAKMDLEKGYFWAPVASITRISTRLKVNGVQKSKTWINMDKKNYERI